MCPEQLRQEKICPDRPAHPLCFADEPEVMTVVAADLAGWACRDSFSFDVPHYHHHGGNDTAEFSTSGTRVQIPPPRFLKDISSGDNRRQRILFRDSSADVRPFDRLR